MKMKLIFVLGMVLIFPFRTFSQSVTATVNSGSHLIKTINWSKYSNVNIMVEKLDGSKRKIYLYSSTRPYNPDAMYVEGLQNDFEQGSAVKVYVIKPRFCGLTSKPIQANVNSGAHLIKTIDWSVYNRRTILVEELNGLNQNIYQYTTTRPSNPNAMYVPGLETDYEQGTEVYVYVIDDIQVGTDKVGIGTTTTQSNLDVNGTIHAREVKVDLTGWSDFVFHPSYQLKSLVEVEQFIKTNGHLQDIPSAAEVEQNGVNVGEMQKKLLQKVEETTLYMIEMSKQIETLKKQNEQLLKDNESLKCKYNELEFQLQYK